MRSEGANIGEQRQWAGNPRKRCLPDVRRVQLLAHEPTSAWLELDGGVEGADFRVPNDLGRPIPLAPVQLLGFGFVCDREDLPDPLI